MSRLRCGIPAVGGVIVGHRVEICRLRPTLEASCPLVLRSKRDAEEHPKHFDDLLRLSTDRVHVSTVGGKERVPQRNGTHAFKSIVEMDYA
jgi:hypothetical protein